MSGIVGIVSREAKNQREVVNEMLNIIKHRGSQYRKILTDKNVTIGFQSDLNTIAQSDNIYLFLDGLIYNGDELINLIFGKNNMQLTDEEILLHLYKKFGLKEFKRVNGDFVVIIWNSFKNTLSFAKYLTNNKNIFYYQNNKNFIFASEIKALFKHPSIERELDINSINSFLTFRHIPAPFTLFRNIRRLKPATALIYKDNTLREIKLNFFDINQKSINLREEEIIGHLYKKLDKATFIRINKIKNFTKNLNLFLSGGIDSTTLLYFLNKHSLDYINTYTVNLPQDKIFANKVSKYFGTNHKSFDLTADNLLEITPKALWYSEYPYAGIDVFQYYLYKISKYDRFIFWGQGAEEIFYGRRDYIAISLKEKLKKFLLLNNLKVDPLLYKISSKSKISKLFKIFFSQKSYIEYVFFREVFSSKERELLLRNAPYILSEEQFLGTEYLGPDKLKNYSILTLMNGFLSDIMPSIQKELLNPYIDKDLINFIYNIPSPLKIKKNQPRYLEKSMMKDKLPQFVIYRTKDSWRIQYLQMTLNENIKIYRTKNLWRTPNWIKNNKKIFYYTDKLMKRLNLPYKTEDLLKINKFNSDYKMWALLTLEIISEIFVDQNMSSEPPLLESF